MEKALSRQRRWQLAKTAMGLCGTCGKRPLVTRHQCEVCARPRIKPRTKKKEETAVAREPVRKEKIAVVKKPQRKRARLRIKRLRQGDYLYTLARILGA
jgi:hypothetical protein